MVDRTLGLTLDRTVRRIDTQGSSDAALALGAYRETPAYVLLGDPGAGKTTAFRREASGAGNAALFVTARDFLTFEPKSHPEWRKRTLFIDGLDEVRAGHADARTPLDEIRRRLDQLGRPPFRISCRDADWLGNNDVVRLRTVSPNGQLVALRLDPLSNEQVRLLIASIVEGGNPAEFLLKTADRGLEGMLTNPQSLLFLAKVFLRTGDLPKSRLETFEQATALLAGEPNEEHRIAGSDLPVDSILDAAGWLCAVQLLSGADGHCLADEEPRTAYVSVSVFEGERHRIAVAALRTRLFTGDRHTGYFRPTHANIAAFLAARTIADLTKKGLPRKRILTLLSGEDGAPPTTLRALAAWLAAISPTLRKDLTERDPVAVLMYGDIREFTTEEKIFLLDQVARDPSRLYEGFWPASAIEGLASEDMEAALRRILNDPDPRDSKQKVAEVVAEALLHTQPRGNLAPDLLAVVRDQTRRFQLRRAALDALIRSVFKEADGSNRLRDALDEIRIGQIRDKDGELLGTLLTALYPRALDASEVWDYLVRPSERLLGLYFRFWNSLSEDCPEDHLPVHLDCLSESISRVRDLLRHSVVEDLPTRLLARALEVGGLEVDPARLVRWLRVGLDEGGRLSSGGTRAIEAADRVREWLEARPGAQKAIIRAALRTVEIRKLESAEYHLGELLYRSALPRDIGAWHLDEAIVAEDVHLAERHIRGFLRALGRQPVAVDAALVDARRRLGGRLDGLKTLESGLYSQLPKDYLENQIKWSHLRSSPSSLDTQLLEGVRSQECALRNNRAPPDLLHAIAAKYYDGTFGPGDHGKRRNLLEALGGDERLTQAAWGGIVRAPYRDDLPSPKEILRLKLRSRMSYFTLPVLAGLGRMSREDLALLGDEQLRTALSFRLVFGALAQGADWYAECVESRPDLVAETLILFGRALLRNGETVIPDFHGLLHDPKQAETARRATAPLLRSFPVRATKGQLRLLDELLWSGLRILDGSRFRKILDDKLDSRSMTRTQRTRWLAAGLAFDPKSFLVRLTGHITDSENQVRSLTEFFAPSFRVPGPTGRLDPAALEFLIRTIGGAFEPLDKDGFVTIREEASDRVHQLISQLAAFPDVVTSRSLNRLVCEPDLIKWRPALQYARDSQRVIRRDANYVSPSAAAAIAALGDGPPVSAADLRELVMDRLERVAADVRRTDTDLWQLFWNQDSYGRPTEPKAENPCRDAVLMLLRGKLPDECRSAPEVVHAGKRRADIGISCGGLRVPVEIKKNSHSDIWRCVRDQLLPRYSNDPATGGLGIYLVLWFGPRYTAPVVQGPRPQTSDELHNRLLAELTAEEHRRAAVSVMDVTPP